MADEVNDAVEHVLSSGLASAGENEILRQLDAELEQQNQARAMVLGADEPAAWVLGGETGGGFGSIARRFISYYTNAIRNEICDTQCGCIKEKYRNLLSGDTSEHVRNLAPAIFDTLKVNESTLSAPASVAALVALWLARVGIEQWCAEAGKAPESTAPAASA
jgi:hypothetical protein